MTVPIRNHKRIQKSGIQKTSIANSHDVNDPIKAKQPCNGTLYIYHILLLFGNSINIVYIKRELTFTTIYIHLKLEENRTVSNTNSKRILCSTNRSRVSRRHKS